MHETPPQPKELLDQELIEALQYAALDKKINKATRSLLAQWSEQEEKKGDKTPEDSIRLQMKQARLYADAGFTDEALEALESARERTINEQNQEMQDQIMAEMDEIEGKM